MSFFHAVYQLLIGPLQLIFEFVYYYARLLAKSPGLAIVVLSLAVNFLLLPMYRRADAIQDKERVQQKEMEHWVKHIRKTFSGNERFMMLQTYYRQNNYKQYYTLRGLLPLILEIPFFIAAYNYLSGLSVLNGVPFGPIADLSKPDAMLPIGSIRINVLPILMTAINLCSGFIYTKGMHLRDKLQLYGMAAVFLVLLYDSPSGLVVYWTMNNLFSLVKNIIGACKNPRRARTITLSIIGVLFWIWMLFMPKAGVGDWLPLLGVGLLFQLPLLLPLIFKNRKKKARPEPVQKDYQPRYLLFLSGCVFLTLLTGVLIPSAVIASSPMEFVDFSAFRHPLTHVLEAFLLAAGLFLIWFGLFYYLSEKRGRCRFGIGVWIISGIAIINYMFFGTNLGTLSAELKFDQTYTLHAGESILNAVILIAAGVLLWLIWKKGKRVIQIVYITLCVAVLGMSGMNFVKIQSANADIETVSRETNLAAEASAGGVGQIIRLSKNGQNVVVLMMDRAVGSYVPYIFAEMPELKEQFAGFTYYPNTLSYGGSTNFAAPALYGGYEYTPTELNARKDEKLADKHDEALKVMPVLFDENGYRVTVVEPSYAGYSWVPNLGIYADYPDIAAYNVEHGQMKNGHLSELAKPLNDVWERNFFCYSIMKVSPVLTQYPVYLDGTYFDSNSSVQYTTGLSKSFGVNTSFMNSYAVMAGLSSITVGEETGGNTFLMMSNSMTHEPQLLQEPDYVPALSVDNTEYDLLHADRFTCEGRTLRMETSTQMEHYHINASAFLRIGEWLDYLRAEGLYDNTRIIIVSDHGFYLRQYQDLILGAATREDVMAYNPLLMVKDFNSTEFAVDNRFMTNADVPTLAVDGLIEDPRNPFTGKRINSDAKAGEQYVLTSGEWDITENNGNTFKPGVWYSVHDDIFDVRNWTKRGRY